MTQQNTTAAIRAALGGMAAGDLSEASTQLLEALGYRSDRRLDGQTGNVGDFIASLSADNADTRSEQDFRGSAREVRILFQFTDAEIAATAQRTLLDAEAFSAGNVRSFLFAAVELNAESYPRGKYVSFTREINKRFGRAPAVVIFRTANGHVTLAFVNRRPSKTRGDRQVLGNVSLIREIRASDPHRAHLDILAELSLDASLKWMDKHGKTHDFDGLLEAWLTALDIEALNRRFYGELFGWFERALKTAAFPAGQAKALRNEEHVIRLITRLMFVWFIKEKGLVAEDLFIENRVGQLLKDYDRDAGDSYYRAVLQNLFFATLNTEIKDRRFSWQTRDDHRNFSVYRYESEIAQADALRELFAMTPFINGGLFDCLDSFDATGAGGVRVDCFSDNPKQRAGYSIPNRLFFGDNAVPGLIDLFNRYKFTVEENTPTEQEVALDPELLGKVFENLLAAVNPETQKTARKETGSYYTPRAVVDYMVDEALVATLAQKAAPDDGDAEYWQERLRYLLDYGDAFTDAETLFTPAERKSIVGAIASITVLDPAVGSGAFPMGILHKLTLALRRLDDRNQLWESLQREIASKRAGDTFDTPDPEERESELTEISRTFDKYRDSDFGRKLYLIQNSIYGVDIQPIATQIAKLRFFISLAIEQEPNEDPTENYGIRPLPNLETRFLAADTLMPLDKPIERTLGETGEVRRLEAELAANRERHFLANTRAAKLACRRRDGRLRKQLAKALQATGFPVKSASQIAAWEPFDQNADPASWFDAEYMFGVSDGFEVVIGNPPYKQVKKGTYPKAQFPFSEGRDKGKQNLYKLFVEQSYNLCKSGSVATLIVQSSLMCDLSSAWTRRLLLEHTQLRQVIEFPKAAPTREAQVFQSVTQGTCIYQFTKSNPDNQPIRISVGNDAKTIADLNFAPITRAAIEDLYPSLRCIPRIEEGSVGILEKIAENPTVKPLRDYVASITQGDLNLTTHSKRFSSTPTQVRLLRGRNIGRYAVKYDTSSEYCDQSFMREQVNANRESVFLISQEVTGTNDVRRLHFGLSENPPTDFLCGHSVNKTQLRNQAHSKAYMALLNSKFMDWFFRITSTNNHVQGYELEQLPIPAMTATDIEQTSKLAESILKSKAADPVADTSADEAEIDRLVYALYGLTDAEIAAVAGKREDVEQLADEWEQNRPRGVDVVEMAEHLAYQRIIEIGVGAVPWLLARLEQRPNHWFLALDAITGANPVPAESQGNIKAMADAWIKWGRENGYQW